MLCYLKIDKLQQCLGIFYFFIVSSENLEFFHLHISKLRAECAFKMLVPPWLSV